MPLLPSNLRAVASALLVVAAVSIVLFGTGALADENLVEIGTSTRYLDNSADPGIGMSWTGIGFDDSQWLDGLFGIGYESNTGTENLILTNVPDTTLSVYTRTVFQIQDPGTVGRLLIGADYDDGWAAWINGVEVYRSPELPQGALDWNTQPGSHESSNGSVPIYGPTHDVTLTALPVLQPGENVLAVGAWNVDPPEERLSSDMVIVPLLANEEVAPRGPYLQVTTPTSTIVRWRSPSLTDSVVFYGENWGDLANTGSSIVDPVLTNEHVVEITGLSPGTRYYYAVGSTSGIVAGDDPDHFVETHPLPGPPKDTRIWVLGDSGFANANQRAVRDSYYEFAGDRQTDVWLHVGDVSQTLGQDDQYQVEFFEAYPTTMRRTALWPTLGNHDAQSASSPNETGPYYENFSMPTDGEAGGLPSSTEAYYSFDYANMHFVSINSYDIDRSPGGDMLTWLALDLADTTADWIIVFWHHPPYSKGKHDSDDPADSGGRSIEMRENAIPILDDHGVDLVLSGHSHSYERSFLLDGHYDTSDTLVEDMKVDDGDGREDGDGAYEKLVRGTVPYTGPGDGAVYVVAGSSSTTDPGPFDHPVMKVSLEVLGSLVLDVNGLRLDAQFLDHTCTESPCTDSVLDYFTIVKDCPSGDGDGDGICDDRDNCPGESNSDQADGDEDGIGDACDPCPADPENDADGDTLCADEDNCPSTGNPDQLDTDEDGEGDACDADDDDDGVLDEEDCAPLSKGISSVPGTIGASVRLDRFGGTTLYWNRAVQGPVSNIYRATLSAGSMVEESTCLGTTTGTSLQSVEPPESGDLFLYLVNAENECAPGTLDPDSDGQERVPGTACAPDPFGDFDFDGVRDLSDNCSQWPNPNQKDGDTDFVGNPCDNCASVMNPDQADCDGDGQGDLCDPGSDCDADGVENTSDNCVYDANPLQEDLDGDEIGDACDACVNDPENDADGDMICGDVDNCPYAPNGNQTNSDDDPLGDACDPDDDNDGAEDDDDCAPLMRGVSAAPDPVGSTLALAPVNGETVLRWLRSYQGHTANLYRGTSDSGSLEIASYDMDCEMGQMPGTEVEQGEDPNPGQLFYYLVSARNVCGDSAAGSDSAGTPVVPGETCVVTGADGDQDGIDDTADNCPQTDNPAQLDADGDFVGNACDNCPSDYNPDQADTNGDGEGDACDWPAE